jgi:hypothetical protein
VLTVQRSEERGRGSWITISAPPVRPNSAFKRRRGRTSHGTSTPCLRGGCCSPSHNLFQSAWGADGLFPRFVFSRSWGVRCS